MILPLESSVLVGSKVPAMRRLRVILNVAVSASLVTLGVLRDPGLLFGLSVAATIGASCEILAGPQGERRSPHRSARAYATDLTHAIGNRYLILPLVTAAGSVLGPLVANVAAPVVRDSFGQLAGWAQLATILVVTDLVNYWSHRALHQVPRLWTFHSVHHSTERLDWLATSRGHPIDLAFAIVSIGLPSFALGRVDVAPWILTFFFLYPFVCHANVRIRLRYVAWLVVTPHFHHWHHAGESRAYDRNFGAILSVWDRIFGTVIEPEEFPERYGIEGSELDREDYLGHMIAPFRLTSAGSAR